ncbi:MAG: FG-GAP-like repeat-containing protein [Acidobacteriota bacterium]
MPKARRSPGVATPAQTICTFLILTFSLLAAGCAPPDDGAGGAEPGAVAADDGTPPVLGVAPYVELVEPTGLAFPFGELRGQLWVAGPLATDAAPEQLEFWNGLQARLAEHPAGAETRRLSLAPASTAPEALKAFAEQLEADVLTWFFLTGDAKQLDRLGGRLGVDSGNVALALVDRTGRVRGHYPGNAAGLDGLVGDLDAVAAEPRPLFYPEDIMNPPWLEDRGVDQRAAVAASSVRQDFAFTDRLADTGITWRNIATEDSGKRYKTNHYDHGNGVVVADVDGDGKQDLYFLTQLGPNGLWRQVDNGRFEDITESAGVAVADRVSVSGAFADYDNDGDPDLFVTTVKQGNLLFQNDGSGRFTDVTETAGVGEVAHSSAAVFFDYDRDGLLDLLVTHVGEYTTDDIGPGGYRIGFPIAFDGHLKPERSERSTLFRNLGDGSFEDVSEQTGLVEAGWNGDASLVDFDGDGWLDLYMTDMQGHDDVYRNVGGERFEDVRSELFPETPFGTMGIQVFDFDNDQKLDIFLTDMHTDMVRKFDPSEEQEKLPAHEMPPLDRLGSDGKHVRGNAFFHNRGGRYEEVSQAIGAENYWPWGLSSGDVNADGYEDAYLTSSMSYGWRYANDALLLNESGERFVASEFALGVEPRVNYVNAVAWHDLDCDDLAEAENFLCQGKSGAFEVWGALGSRSSVILDLEGDGDLDIVVNEFHAPPRILISDLSERGDVAYLEVDLEGRASNRDGIGASVVLTAGDRTYRKVLDGNAGYLSFSPQALYFGLGDAAGVDSIEVTWPSGAVQKVDGPIEINRRLEIVEPEAAP